LFAEQETESSRVHRMFAYGNILFFVGNYSNMLFCSLFLEMLFFWKVFLYMRQIFLRVWCV